MLISNQLTSNHTELPQGIIESYTCCNNLLKVYQHQIDNIVITYNKCVDCETKIILSIREVK